jgi:hypothetical protein
MMQYSPRSRRRVSTKVLGAILPLFPFFLAIVGLGFSGPAAALTFTTWQDLTGVFLSDAAWGDIDNDGDLDLAISGQASATSRVTKVYKSASGTLTLWRDLDGVENEGSGNLAWGDYDGDGDLDLVVAGSTGTTLITRIYENTDGNGALTWDSSQNLTGVGGASVAWGDYDNDGDLDLLVKGYTTTQSVTLLYKNHPLGVLTVDPTQSLVGMSVGSADWADWDRDGDLDLLLTGSDGTSRRTIFYRNNPTGTLVNDGAHGLPLLYLSDAAWGDYDNDGDLDLAITGEDTTPTKIARVYTNDGSGNLTLLGNLSALYRSACAWGDYDNDGLLDVSFSGYTTSLSTETKIYRNTGAGFAVQVFSLQGTREGSVSWADVDHDRDLDFLVTGASGTTNFARLYQNSGGSANTQPGVPTNLAGNYNAGTGVLSLGWTGAADTQTPVNGLYYALRVGSYPQGNDVYSGTYATPLMGNEGQRTTVSLTVPQSQFYWSVREVDTGLLASGWAAEQSVCPPEGSTWYIHDVGIRGWGPDYVLDWETMDALAPTGSRTMQDLDSSSPYFAASCPTTRTFTDTPFYAQLWLANNYSAHSNPITVELWKGLWGAPTTLVASASDVITTDIVTGYAQPYLFYFGVIPSLSLNNESLVLKIIYHGAMGDGHIYWNGTDGPSALHAGPYPWADMVVCEPQGGNPAHPSRYWYDVTPGLAGRCDFHVRVYDDVAGDYSNPTLPNATWQFAVHQVGDEWWASWWDPDCMHAISSTFRFAFDNTNRSTWGDWTTTIGACSNPMVAVRDMSVFHGGQANGSGHLVHVPAPSDFMSFYIDDAAPTGFWYSAMANWEPMGPDVVLDNCEQESTLPNLMYWLCAGTAPMTRDMSAYHMYADIWLSNPNAENVPVEVDLIRGHWGVDDSLVAVCSRNVRPSAAPTKYRFDFNPGPPPSVLSLRLRQNSLVLRIRNNGLHGLPVLVHWNGVACPSALFAVPLVSGIQDLPETYGNTVAGPILESSRPNPFSGSTTIWYSIPASGRTTLQVFDAAGRVVRRLYSADQDPGRHSAVWNGLDDHERRAPNGVYLYKLQSNGAVVSGHVILIR